MRQNHEHPLCHLDAETLLVATYIWVDDELKTLGRVKAFVYGGHTAPEASSLAPLSRRQSP